MCNLKYCVQSPRSQRTWVWLCPGFCFLPCWSLGEEPSVREGGRGWFQGWLLSAPTLRPPVPRGRARHLGPMLAGLRRPFLVLWDPLLGYPISLWFDLSDTIVFVYQVWYPGFGCGLTIHKHASDRCIRQTEGPWGRRLHVQFHAQPTKSPAVRRSGSDNTSDLHAAPTHTV